LLKEGGKAIGYIIAVPHEDLYVELVESDSEFPNDSDRYYVETLCILPEARKGMGFMKLILKLIEEAESRGRHKFSMHVRVENGLSQVIQKFFGKMVTKVRRVEKLSYFNYEEPADYIETDHSLKKK
jgi:ribosomal protein S18 acetylase RimI-like enzyme